MIFLPKSWSPSDFGRELIQELLSLLPSNRAEALWTQMGKNRAHFLAFDHNDASTLLSAFHAAYLRLPSGVPKSMDEYLADLSSSSDGLFRHLRSSLTPNTREILADIRGLEFVDCDGTLFYSLYEGIVFRAPFVVGARSGNFFESLVTKFRPVTVDEFLEIIEEVEGYQ